MAPSIEDLIALMGQQQQQQQQPQALPQPAPQQPVDPNADLFNAVAQLRETQSPQVLAEDQVADMVGLPPPSASELKAEELVQATTALGNLIAAQRQDGQGAAPEDTFSAVGDTVLRGTESGGAETFTSKRNISRPQAEDERDLEDIMDRDIKDLAAGRAGPEAAQRVLAVRGIQREEARIETLRAEADELRSNARNLKADASKTEQTTPAFQQQIESETALNLSSADAKDAETKSRLALLGVKKAEIQAKADLQKLQAKAAVRTARQEAGIVADPFDVLEEMFGKKLPTLVDEAPFNLGFLTQGGLSIPDKFSERGKAAVERLEAEAKLKITSTEQLQKLVREFNNRQ